MNGGAVTLLILIVLLVLVFSPSSAPTEQCISRNVEWRTGLPVPIPTLPFAAMSSELVGAPGRMRKGKTRTTGHVAHEEVCFVAADVPRLRGEAAAVVLFESNRRRVGGVRVHIQHGRCGPESDIAVAAHTE